MQLAKYQCVLNVKPYNKVYKEMYILNAKNTEEIVMIQFPCHSLN